MRDPSLVSTLNLRIHETMPITSVSYCVRKDNGVSINYFEEHWGVLFVEVRCRLVPGSRILVAIPDNELEITEENRLSIAIRIGGAAKIIERHAWN